MGTGTGRLLILPFCRLWESTASDTCTDCSLTKRREARVGASIRKVTVELSVQPRMLRHEKARLTDGKV